MAPSEPPSDITVRVKVPQGHIEGGSDEFTLGTIPTRSKIGEVRLRIQQTLPSNPGPERQRLLYAGRALVDNDQTLTEALNTRRDTTQTEYVIHLLVKGDSGDGQATSSTSGHARAASTPTAARAGTPQGPANVAHHHMPGLMPGLPQGVPQGIPQGFPQQAQDLAQQQGLNQQQMQQQMQQQWHQQMQMQRLMQPQMQHQMQQQQMLLQQQQIQRQRVQELMQQQPIPFGTVDMHRNPQHLQQPIFNASTHQAMPNANQQDPASNGSTAQVAEAAPANNAHNSQQIPAAAPQTGNPNNTSGQPQGVPGRPISGQGFHMHGVGANGNRFEIHQQTMNIPLGGPHNQQMPFPMGLPQLPGIGLPFPMPGMAQHHNQGIGTSPPGSSALERARQNVTEMRRMVDEMRNENATEEERTRMARLQDNIDAVNQYIDPFGMARTNGGSRSQSPFPTRAPSNALGGPFGAGVQQRMPSSGMPPQPSATTAQQQASNPSDVTCYLLSSPSGPQALLLSPQHGSYTGTMAHNARHNFTPGVSTGYRQAINASGQPTPTPTQPGNGAAQPGEQGAAAGQIALPQNPAQAPAQAQAPAAAEVGGPLQALLNHFWLLFRVLIFAYFLLGANMGWRRPVALLLISAGFWMIRNGLFGDGGVARRWWDGIVRVDQGGAGQQGANNVNEQVIEGQMPTPEQVAARILREREEAARHTPLGRARELVRPVERAAALFVASLWPGVGEAHVRAREAEERRLAEAEVERRRLEEEAKREAEEKEKEEQGQIEGDVVSEKAGLKDKESSNQEVTAESSAMHELHEGEKRGMPSAFA